MNITYFSAPKFSASTVVSPCSDCGPNADCIDGQCRCKPNYFGAAPFCRPECLSSSDCEWRFTCMNQRCVDPCPGACGRGAVCLPVAHEPRCECPPSTTGNPLVDCRQFDDISKTDPNKRLLFALKKQKKHLNYVYVARYKFWLGS